MSSTLNSQLFFSFSPAEATWRGFLSRDGQRLHRFTAFTSFLSGGWMKPARGGWGRLRALLELRAAQPGTGNLRHAHRPATSLAFPLGGLVRVGATG